MSTANGRQVHIKTSPATTPFLCSLTAQQLIGNLWHFLLYFMAVNARI